MTGSLKPSGRAKLREIDGQLIGVDAEVPIDDGADWYAAGFFVLRDDDLVLAEFRVIPSDGERPSDWFRGVIAGAPQIGAWSQDPESVPTEQAPRLTSRLVRKALFDELVRIAKSEVLAAQEAAPDTRLRSGGGALVTAARRPTRPGRRGHSDLFYAQLAARQVAKHQSGSRAPNHELAEEEGTTPEQVAQWIHAARQRDLLEATTQGKAHPVLTKKATQLLEEDDSEIRSGLHDLEQDGTPLRRTDT